MWEVDLTGCSSGRVGSEMKDKIRNNTRIAMQNPEVRTGVPILLRPVSSLKVAGTQIRLRLQQNAQKQGSKTGMRYGVQLAGPSTPGEPG